MADDTFYISSISVTNIFGCKDVNWQLFEDVNILGGINGSGKSTIISAVHRLMTTGFMGERQANLIDKVVLNFTNGATLTWEKQKATLKTYVPDETYRYKVDTTRTDEDGYFTVQRSRFTDADGQVIPITRLTRTMQVDYLSAFDQMRLRQDIAEAIGETRLQTNLDLMLYREISRRNQLLVSSLRFLSLVNKHREITQLQKQLQQALSEIHDNDDDNIEIARLEETIASKLDFTSQSLIDIHELIDKFFASTGKRSVKDAGTFKFITGEDCIDYMQLSTGEKQLLLVLLKASNTECRPSVILLDEADLGMHIEWKERLISTLRDINPHMQVIIATHAPSVIKGWFENVKEMDEISTYK